MADFTTTITDNDVINQLPDMSVLDNLYNENSTVEDVKNFIDSSVLRKKLQQLLEFQMSDDVIAKLQQSLMDAFIASQPEGTTVNKKSDTEVEINGKLYIISIKKFGDSIFTNTHFNEVFFTQDVMDEVFKQNDLFFERALYNVDTFWDNLLVNNELWEYVKSTYPNKVQDAYKNVELAYVKIAVKEAGLETYNKFSTLEELVSRATTFSLVLSEDASRNITLDSPFGLIGRAMFLSGESDIAAIANNEELIAQMSNDSEIREALCVFEVVNKAGKDSKLYTAVVNNDAFLGLLLSQYYHLDVNLTFSQFVYEDSYREYFESLVNNPDLLNLVKDSSIMGLIYEDFIRTYYAVSIFKNIVYGQQYDDKVRIVTVDDSGNAKYFDVVFPDETSDTFSVTGNAIDFGEYVVAPMYISDDKFGAISMDRKIKFNNSDMYLYFTMASNVNVSYAGTNKNHMVIITVDGELKDNKYYTEEKFDIKKIKSVILYNTVTLIQAEDKIVVLGETAYDSKSVSTIATANLTDIANVFPVGNKIIAVLNSNAVKEITDSELVDSNVFDDYKLVDDDNNVTSSAVSNGVVKTLSLGENLFVLDKTHTLWYKDADGSIVTVANINDIQLGNDAINVETTDGSKYIYVIFGGKIRKYNYLSNL